MFAGTVIQGALSTVFPTPRNSSTVLGTNHSTHSHLFVQLNKAAHPLKRRAKGGAKGWAQGTQVSCCVAGGYG